MLASLTNEALMEALKELPTEQQECLVMRFLQGLSIAETAPVLGPLRRCGQAAAAARRAQPGQADAGGPAMTARLSVTQPGVTTAPPGSLYHVTHPPRHERTPR